MTQHPAAGAVPTHHAPLMMGDSPHPPNILLWKRVWVLSVGARARPAVLGSAGSAGWLRKTLPSELG